MENPKIPWQERKIKYRFREQNLIVEEITNAWDLLVESKFINNFLSNPLHQLSIESKIERIFSVRQLPNRYPVFDILTRPTEARVLLPYWGPWRVLKTNNPMIIDGQRLLLVAAFEHEKFIDEKYLPLLEEFYLAKHGVLENELPNGSILQSRREIEDWKALCQGRSSKDLFCGTTISNFVDTKNQYGPFLQALTEIEATTLLNKFRFKNIVMDFKERDWCFPVLDYLKNHPYDKPYDKICVFGGGEVNDLINKARKIMR